MPYYVQNHTIESFNGLVQVQVEKRKQEKRAKRRSEQQLKAMAARELRTWTSGSFSVSAHYLRTQGDKVVLEKENGEIVEVKLSLLSRDDQEFVSANDY